MCTGAYRQVVVDATSMGDDGAEEIADQVYKPARPFSLVPGGNDAANGVGGSASSAAVQDPIGSAVETPESEPGVVPFAMVAGSIQFQAANVEEDDVSCSPVWHIMDIVIAPNTCACRLPVEHMKFGQRPRVHCKRAQCTHGRLLNYARISRLANVAVETFAPLLTVIMSLHAGMPPYTQKCVNLLHHNVIVVVNHIT